MSALTCLVTGGTGFLGGHLVERLCHEGFDVYVFARSSSDTSLAEQAGAAIVVGDLKNQEDLIRAAMNKDYIFHVGEPDLSDPDYFVSACNSIRALCEGAGKTNCLKRFVFISALTTAMTPLWQPADENTPIKKPYIDMYSLAKQYQENYLSRSKHPATVLRAGFIYGPRCPTYLNLTKTMIKFGRLGTPLPGRPETAINFINVFDLVEALVMASQKDQQGFNIYHIVDDRPVTVKTFLNLFKEHLGVPIQYRRVPVFIQFILAWLVDIVKFCRGFPNARQAVRWACEDQGFINTKIKTDLNFKLNYPTVTEGMATLTEWLKKELL